MKVLFVRKLIKGLWKVASWLPGTFTRLTWKLPGPFKYVAVIVAVITYGLTPVLYYKIPDAATRLFLSDNPTIIVHEGNPAVNANITVYGGAGSSPSAQVSELLPTLLQHAKKVRVVEYPKYLFNDEKTVDAVDAAIDADQERAKAENRPEEEEVFIGISMGGPLSYDTIEKGIAEGDNPTKYSAVMYGSPYDEDDVIGVKDWLKTADDFFLFDFTGLITSEITGPIAGLPDFKPGDPSKMSPYINKEELAKSNESYENWKASSWADQGSYVFGHEPMHALPGVRWVYVQAEDDKFVDDPGAYRKYQASQGGAVYLLSVVGGHVSFHDWPREYAAVTGSALGYALAA